MPRSRSLAVRMVLVTVLTPVIAVGLLGLVFAYTPSRWMFGLIVGLTIGIFARAVKLAKSRREPFWPLSERDDPELFGILDRLCAVADMPRPQVSLSEKLSRIRGWCTSRGTRRACTSLAVCANC